RAERAAMVAAGVPAPSGGPAAGHRSQRRPGRVRPAVPARSGSGRLRMADRRRRPHNTIAFVRRDEADDPVVVVLNFSAQPWTEYRVPLPEGGTWLEVLNTDSPVYGGSGVGNLG